MADAERLRNVARIITDTYKAGNQVVAVLSAQGDTTDDLIEKAKEINPNASNREMDMLLSTGSRYPYPCAPWPLRPWAARSFPLPDGRPE